MFELCKYLDTLRNKSNNTIDSKFLIRIVRLGKNDKHINELNDSDLKYFLNLKEFSSEYEWENIDSILESFNENWKKRQSIQNQLEEHLINGSYKLADDYYLKHLGGLIYNTQYKPLKTRCISKCDFMIALRNLEFENAEVLFYKQCNSDLVDIFEKKILRSYSQCSLSSR